MITYSLHVLSPNPSHMSNLVSTCREGGLINALIRQLPGCLNMSVLVSNQVESEILVIIFFTSLEAAIDATGSPMGMFLFNMLERISKRSRNLGLFSFPVLTGDGADDIATQLTPAASVH